jgi:very-short-patch-repair endonuclease
LSADSAVFGVFRAYSGAAVWITSAGTGAVRLGGRMGGFRTRDALVAGVPRAALYDGRYHRPFHGMRTLSPPGDHGELCRSATLVLPDGAAFSHRSAAFLHGMPLPRRALPEQVEVSVFEPDRPPRLRGIVGHQLMPTGQRVVRVDGMRVLAPEDVWVQLGVVLTPDELTVIGDYLVTGDEPFSGEPPPTTREQLEGALRRHGRHRGVRDLRLAATRIRYGSLSPQESRLRLALEDAQLPAPELNYRVAGADGETAAMIDLAYPAYRVAIEYLGDHHRSTPKSYRKDIHRREWLIDQGWDAIFVTAADSFPDVARRVRSALRRSLTK